MPSMMLNHEALQRFEESIQKEWITTNSLGGYSSSTVLGLNTRKYHGLLIAAFHPPGDRRVCLSKLDEEVTVGNNTCPLGSNEFRDVIFPQGHRYLKEFSLSPFPTYSYSAQNVDVKKTIFMPHEKSCVLVLYRILNRNDLDATVRVFPLVNLRGFHSVTDRWKIPTEPQQTVQGRECVIRFNASMSSFALGATAGAYIAHGVWIEKIFYREEAKRGESSLDDCYQSGFFEVKVGANKSESLAIKAVADENEGNARKILAEMPETFYDAVGLRQKEEQRRENFLKGFYESHRGPLSEDWLKWLVLAADSFIAREKAGEHRSVIAGYHWFGVWGRDTFVSLPGLLLVTGRFDDARRVFLTFREYWKQGLVPNFLPDHVDTAAYNTVDATLWFVNALFQYVKYTGDFEFVRREFWEVLKDIVENHMKGTMFDIHVDGDGLLSHAGQLTWMDATFEGKPVTPREGKAVEVQALWHNALGIVGLLARRFGDGTEAEKVYSLAGKVKKAFVEKFWNSDRNCLFDVVNEHGSDGSFRPNQILAVSLDFSMLDAVKGGKVVDAVHRELLTPYGLRTLERKDSRYVGVYSGDRSSRDNAYHNGTVWPWLQGPFTTAFLKMKGYADFRREFVLRNFLLPLLAKQVFEAGLGTISEIFDGEPPHTARGCISQAWSVAEPLRAYVEDAMQIRPSHEKEALQGLG